MIKRLFSSALFVVMAGATFAQTVQDGIKSLYYEQYTKAKEIFSKLVAANPADPEANYWLGQVYLNNGNLAEAKAQYAKAMTATSQNPLIVIGMGHVEVLEKKNAEAKAHFDAALEPTKNKKNKNFGDPVLLEAIGRANADGGSENGDPVYGIEKLQQAAQLDLKNPEVMVNIGISQLKRGGEYGGEAKKAFDAALERDPNYAAAYMRIGRIFESQNNKEQFLDNYNKAIQVDQMYAPAYLALYAYYQNRDVNKAGELLDQYIAHSEKSRDLDYFKADYKLRSGKYEEALAMAKQIEGGLNGENFPKLHKLYSIIQSRLGDSLTAKNELETYLAQENPAKITSEDYLNAGLLYGKFPGSEAKANEYFNKTLSGDTVMANKVALIKQIAEGYSKVKNCAEQLRWLDTLAIIKPDQSATEMFYHGAAAECDSNYTKAMEIYRAYITKYPDQPQGYGGQMRAAIKSDPDTSKGIAIAAIDSNNAFMMKDTAKNKNRIITNIGYKVYYYANKSKDYQKAIDALDEILALDPGNTYAQSAKEQILKIMKKSGSSPKPGSGGKATPSSEGLKNNSPTGK